MLGMTEMAILGSNIFPYIQRIVESGTICITPALAEYVFLREPPRSGPSM